MDDTFTISPELEKELWKVPVDAFLIKDARISDRAFRLYLVLLCYAREKTECWPSRETLRKDLAYTKTVGKGEAAHREVVQPDERSIDRWKRELEELGLLSWEQYFSPKDKRLHNRYTLDAYKPLKSTRETVGSRVGRPQGPVNNNQSSNDTKYYADKPHNSFRKRTREPLSEPKMTFLKAFSEAHQVVRGTAYSPIGTDWGALQRVSDETIAEILRIDDAYRKRGSKPLLVRWLGDYQGDWENSTAKNIAVLLKQDVLDRFLGEYQRVSFARRE